MPNEMFLKTLSLSFEKFLEKGTSRSTDKLKPLHGAIAADIACRLGSEYEVCSQGYNDGRESIIRGRYLDKRVDITIKHNGEPVAGIAVKFVMQNYARNSVNYFENMLGETANIRSASYPYFQIFIIPDRLPHYNKGREIKHWEIITAKQLSKYVRLSSDDSGLFYHTPNKTLLYIIHAPQPDDSVLTADDYLAFYRTHDHRISLSDISLDELDNGVILNDYETFIEKVYYTVKAI